MKESDRWLGLSAGTFTAAAMLATGAVTISVGGMPPWVVATILLLASFGCLMEWRRTTGSGDCDAPACVATARVSVSDETAFCADHAAVYYDDAEGST